MKSTSLPTSVLEFLGDIKENNNREWFTANKGRYQETHGYFKDFAEALVEEMSHYDEIESHKVYRIYRDIRFSKDKTPYKTHFSGHMVRATKLRRGGYYFHIEPGNSMVGGGFWNPNSPDLKRIREEIAADDQPLRKILGDKDFVKTFGTLHGDQVKSAPKGYKKDHPAIDLLRYKQFLLSHTFTDQEITSKDLAKKMAEVFHTMRPFFDYMSEVLTTDANGVPIV